MTTHKVKQEIDEELMQNFFKFLGRQEPNVTTIAFNLATQENSGRYFDMLSEANIIYHFAIFLLEENNNLLKEILGEQSIPIRELLKLGLIKTDIELFKTH